MNSDDSIYTGFEFEMEGFPALAIINSDLKKMDERYNFKHSVFIDILPDKFNDFGHPEEEEYDYLNEVEKKIIEYLETQTESL
jgi:hypothetical protein